VRRKRSGVVRAGVAVALVALGASACASQENAQPICGSGSPTVLMAESVPSASLIPCVRALPGGWTYRAFEADDTGSTFSLQESDLGAVLEVRFTAGCEPTGQPKPVSGFPTVKEYRTVQAGGASTVWFATFPGGCARTEATFPSPPSSSDLTTIYGALSFIPRSDLQQS
jgi:hypothetical protein